MAYQFTVPGKTLIGPGALALAENAVRELGTKALIVTGRHVSQNGIVKTLADHLDHWQIRYEIFSGITGEPSDEMIRAGIRAYEASSCDFLIGIGGGSPLDSAKAIAAFSVLKCSPAELMGKEIRGKFPPTVLIPTTAGTGSETTKFTIITDTRKNVKMLLKGDCLLPEVAIIDPELTLSAPRSITAATGMDALTHAVESYTSRKANPVTDLFAVSAVKRIFRYLPAAFQDGSDKKAREEMALAAYEAGICINNASVTLVHGMSRPIGALFHVPHGISNAMLIRECLAFAIDGCPERFAALARAASAADEQTPDRTAALRFLDALETLCEALQIPTLETYGIDRKEFVAAMDKMAADALESGSPANTIREVTKEDILSIYRKLW